MHVHTVSLEVGVGIAAVLKDGPDATDFHGKNGIRRSLTRHSFIVTHSGSPALSVSIFLFLSVFLSVPYIIKTPETHRGHVLGGRRKRHKESKYPAQGP